MVEHAKPLAGIDVAASRAAVAEMLRGAANAVEAHGLRGFFVCILLSDESGVLAAHAEEAKDADLLMASVRMLWENADEKFRAGPDVQ